MWIRPNLFMLHLNSLIYIYVRSHLCSIRRRSLTSSQHCAEGGSQWAALQSWHEYPSPTVPARTSALGPVSVSGQCQVRTSHVKPTRDKVVLSDMGNQSAVPPPFRATSSSWGCNTRFFCCSFTAVHEAPFLLPPPAASHCQGAHHSKLCWFVTGHVVLPRACPEQEGAEQCCSTTFPRQHHNHLLLAPCLLSDSHLQWVSMAGTCPAALWLNRLGSACRAAASPSLHFHPEAAQRSRTFSQCAAIHSPKLWETVRGFQKRYKFHWSWQIRRGYLTSNPATDRGFIWAFPTPVLLFSHFVSLRLLTVSNSKPLCGLNFPDLHSTMIKFSCLIKAAVMSLGYFFRLLDSYLT